MIRKLQVSREIMAGSGDCENCLKIFDQGSERKRERDAESGVVLEVTWNHRNRTCWLVIVMQAPGTLGPEFDNRRSYGTSHITRMVAGPAPLKVAPPI